MLVQSTIEGYQVRRRAPIWHEQQNDLLERLKPRQAYRRMLRRKCSYSILSYRVRYFLAGSIR